MKKFGILSMCLAIGLGAMAQEALLKEAEQAMKKGKDVEEVIKMVTPAFTDPTTAQMAFTYYIPGKAGYKQYDELMALEALGQLDENGKAKKTNAIYQGFEYFMKALPLDPVTDAKGKIKTKYTKEIVNTIAGHYNDLNYAAGDMWNAKQYDKAYKLWYAYSTLPKEEAFVKAMKPYNIGDTTLSETMFNAALAAWQAEDLEASLNAFLAARDLGYHKQALYDYGMAVAQLSKHNDKALMLAKEGFEKYGSENPNYIGMIINNCIEEKRYTDAINMVDQAIAGDPNNAQYYVIKGIIIESNEDIKGDPKEHYEKAVAVDGKHSQALYNLGRMYYNEALQIYNNAPEGPEFGRIFAEEFTPVMKQAVDLFEKAWDADNDNMDNLKLLEQAYYMLQDEDNLQKTKDRMK